MRNLIHVSLTKIMTERADTFTWDLTRPYTRAEVACGWAGAAKKQSVTDQPTDRRTEWVVESRARDLK